MSRASTPNSSKHHAGLLITIGVTPIHVRARGASAWKIARKRVESRPPSDPGSTVPEHKKHKFFVILTKLAAIAGHVMPIRRYEPLHRRVSTTMNELATDFLYDRWDLVSENGYRSLLVLYSAVQLKNLIETIKSIGDVLKESALSTGTAEAAEPLILRPEGNGRK